jgi:hypothetical protein
VTHTTTPTSKRAEDATAPHEHPTIDVDRLARDLFDKFVAAQLDLLRARALEDHRAADERLLCLRASGLLLACLPAHPDSEPFRLKVMVTGALRDEDGSTGSHAWLMCERALAADDPPQPLVPLNA